jgi:hypothetical protein
MLGSYKSDTSESNASPHETDSAPLEIAQRASTPVPIEVPGVPPAIDELTPSPQFSLSDALAQAEADRKKQHLNFVWPAALPLPQRGSGRAPRRRHPPPATPSTLTQGTKTWMLAIGAVVFLLAAALMFHSTLSPDAAASTASKPQRTTELARLAPAPVPPDTAPPELPTQPPGEPLVLPVQAEPDASASAKPASEPPHPQKTTAPVERAVRAPNTPPPPAQASARRGTSPATRVPWWE